jgi:uncharacterized membrane protein YraQ (UPF0718 family)
MSKNTVVGITGNIMPSTPRPTFNQPKAANATRHGLQIFGSAGAVPLAGCLVAGCFVSMNPPYAGQR